MLNRSLYVECILLLTTSVSCSGPSVIARSYTAPAAPQLLKNIENRQAIIHSFFAKSRMEYWIKGERIKPTVYAMGQRGAKVRFNALGPTEDVAADLACNGSDFKYVDFNNNCYLTGPCRREAISQLLRIHLSPDDFFLLAIGSTPIIPDSEASLEWVSGKEQEKLTLVSQDQQWKQVILLDGKNQHWDVLSSTLWNSKGEVQWKLSNKGFSDKKIHNGTVYRLPAKTRFEQPTEKAEVTIRWEEQELNIELAPEKFVMEIEPGLLRCGEPQAGK